MFLPSLVALLLVAQAQPAVPPRSAELETLLSQARAERYFPGAVALVSRRGEAIARAAVGVRRLGADDRVTLADHFHLGSVTKPINATMIATLVDEGLLRWDETLEELFPDWPIHRALRPVTLAQLLSHRSGIARFGEEADFQEAPTLYGDARAQRAQFAQWLLQRKPEHEPGSRFSYSNAGVAVAAAAAERAAGRAWEDLVRERVFVPLGMKGAGFGWPARDDRSQPWGHNLVDGRLVPHGPRGPYQLTAVIRPAADIQLDIEDLARFLDDHARGIAGQKALLRPGTYARMHAGAPVDTALGWSVRMRDGRAVSGHSGSAETFYAVVMVAHDDGLEVALMLNSPDAPAANALFLRIWNRFSPPGGGAPG